MVNDFVWVERGIVREVLIVDGGVDVVCGYEEGGCGGCGVGEGYFDCGFCFLGGVRYLW